jgi:hypothetical protein
MKNGMNELKSTDTMKVKGYSCGNKALHIAIVIRNEVAEIVKKIKNGGKNE